MDGEPFDAVVVASGRFRRPHLPPGLERFGGERLHAFDYAGAEPFRDRRTLVYGNGISGLEIASDLARVAPVVSACRKPRYVIQKVVDGVSSDWQWYTHFGALQRRGLPRAELGRTLRERVVRVAGNPAEFGAPEPVEDILVAGLSLCQDWLAQVAEGRIGCRPAIAAIDGRTVTFADGAREEFEVLICATGYELDLPYLPPDVRALLGPRLALHRRTLHPDLPGFGVVGQFLAQGPYFPLLELQARWIVATWAGEAAPPAEAHMRRGVAEPAPPLDPHNLLALTLAEELGVVAGPAGPAGAHGGAALRAAAAAALPTRRPGRATRGRGALRRAARGLPAGARGPRRRRGAARLRTGRRRRPPRDRQLTVTTSSVRVPLGVGTSTTSPARAPTSTRPTGESMESRPAAASASTEETSV